MLQRKAEEVLEAIWTQRKRGIEARNRSRGMSNSIWRRNYCRNWRKGSDPAGEGWHLSHWAGKTGSRTDRKKAPLGREASQRCPGMNAEEAESNACEFEHAVVQR